MKITRAAEVVTRRGPADYFTGVVWVEELSTVVNAADVGVAVVTFESGARTAWHTHPHGQLLKILSGLGRVQKAGEAVREVRPGDAVWFAPGERHWHGAATNRTMAHLAVQRADAAGKTVAWQEHVADADYTAAVGGE